MNKNNLTIYLAFFFFFLEANGRNCAKPEVPINIDDLMSAAKRLSCYQVAPDDKFISPPQTDFSVSTNDFTKTTKGLKGNGFILRAAIKIFPQIRKGIADETKRKAKSVSHTFIDDLTQQTVERVTGLKAPKVESLANISYEQALGVARESLKSAEEKIHDLEIRTGVEIDFDEITGSYFACLEKMKTGFNKTHNLIDSKGKVLDIDVLRDYLSRLINQCQKNISPRSIAHKSIEQILQKLIGVVPKILEQKIKLPKGLKLEIKDDAIEKIFKYIESSINHCFSKKVSDSTEEVDRPKVENEAHSCVVATALATADWMIKELPKLASINDFDFEDQIKTVASNYRNCLSGQVSFVMGEVDIKERQKLLCPMEGNGPVNINWNYLTSISEEARENQVAEDIQRCLQGAFIQSAPDIASKVLEQNPELNAKLTSFIEMIQKQFPGAKGFQESFQSTYNDCINSKGHKKDCLQQAIKRSFDKLGDSPEIKDVKTCLTEEIDHIILGKDDSQPARCAAKSISLVISMALDQIKKKLPEDFKSEIDRIFGGPLEHLKSCLNGVSSPEQIGQCMNTFIDTVLVSMTGEAKVVGQNAELRTCFNTEMSKKENQANFAQSAPKVFLNCFEKSGVTEIIASSMTSQATGLLRAKLKELGIESSESDRYLTDASLQIQLEINQFVGNLNETCGDGLEPKCIETEVKKTFKKIIKLMSYTARRINSKLQVVDDSDIDRCLAGESGQKIAQLIERCVASLVFNSLSPAGASDAVNDSLASLALAVKSKRPQDKPEGEQITLHQATTPNEQVQEVESSYEIIAKVRNQWTKLILAVKNKLPQAETPEVKPIELIQAILAKVQVSGDEKDENLIKAIDSATAKINQIDNPSYDELLNVFFDDEFYPVFGPAIVSQLDKVVDPNIANFLKALDKIPATKPLVRDILRTAVKAKMEGAEPQERVKEFLIFRSTTASNRLALKIYLQFLSPSK